MRRGQGLIEYGLILSLILVVAIAAIMASGQNPSTSRASVHTCHELSSDGRCRVALLEARLEKLENEQRRTSGQDSGR